MATTKTIELRTAVPGPRGRAVLERKERAIVNAKAITLPVVAAEARGSTITDVDGNTFIDFTGGVGCLNVGHANPRVLEAAHEQLDRFTHTDFTVVPYELYVTLAERLLALAPFRGPAKAAFFNAGTEAVENAVKFARLYTRRPAVIAFEGGFHGRTLLSMTLTSRPHPYKAGMGPLAPEVYRAPFPYEYRGVDAAAALRGLRDLFTTHVAAEQVAAIVVEPEQGEGGFVPAPIEFMQGLRAICDEHGIVLVVDEVQTGFGRTGKLFATEHYGIEPDVMTLAKSIAGGLPLSAVLGKAEILDAAHDGGAMRSRMESWRERFDAIGDVRGLGTMLALEFVRDRDTKEPAPELATAVVDAALQRGLLLLKAGVHGNCIRVLCPLVIEDAELDEALAVWEDALAAALG